MKADNVGTHDYSNQSQKFFVFCFFSQPYSEFSQQLKAGAFFFFFQLLFGTSQKSGKWPCDLDRTSF